MDEGKKPVWCMWLDLETTGLEPSTDHILELHYQLTEFEHPHRRAAVRVPEATYLVRGPGRDALLAGTCSGFILDMHGKSGLTEALRVDDGLTSLETIEADLLALSEDWPTEKDEKVVLAGNTIGFDLGFLRVHMPTFAKRLSHRTFDVSSHYLHLRSLGMPAIPKPDAVHRARADIEASMTLSRRCAEWVLDRQRDK